MYYGIWIILLIMVLIMQIFDQDVNADPCDPESIGDTGGQGHIPIWNALLNNDDFLQITSIVGLTSQTTILAVNF